MGCNSSLKSIQTTGLVKFRTTQSHQSIPLHANEHVVKANCSPSCFSAGEQPVLPSGWGSVCVNLDGHGTRVSPCQRLPWAIPTKLHPSLRSSVPLRLSGPRMGNKTRPLQAAMALLPACFDKSSVSPCLLDRALPRSPSPSYL
jgi:hypothetical protein